MCTPALSFLSLAFPLRFRDSRGQLSPSSALGWGRAAFSVCSALCPLARRDKATAATRGLGETHTGDLESSPPSFPEQGRPYFPSFSAPQTLVSTSTGDGLQPAGLPDKVLWPGHHSHGLRTARCLEPHHTPKPCTKLPPYPSLPCPFC